MTGAASEVTTLRRDKNVHIIITIIIIIIYYYYYTSACPDSSKTLAVMYSPIYLLTQTLTNGARRRASSCQYSYAQTQHKIHQGQRSNRKAAILAAATETHRGQGLGLQHHELAGGCVAVDRVVKVQTFVVVPSVPSED